ncbi:hypothetical protein FNV43_RR04607 [Rhamnella rubrinervis]|uniref:Scarecrow-like protein 3 n=1 Tax=Rhamnella rubrinervis TaxID=2594499 RepID=A0A8K0MQR9_9ROSA|nr:hypothetical protein FNV43_RR04607 [Rhamnella rubrinervis]
MLLLVALRMQILPLSKFPISPPDGDTMQRMAAYFTEALADRILKTWPGLHKALNSTRMSLLSEEILVRKVAFVLANQAITEAMEGEKMVHIIDLNATEPAKWIALLQVLSARPEGPPHLRITSVHQQREKILMLKNFVSKRGGSSYQLRSSTALLLASDEEHLRKKSSPLASKNLNGTHLSRVLQMNQSTLGELLEKDLVNGYSPSPDSASSSPLSLTASVKMDSFLNSLWGLTPKIMVITEQDSNHNGSTLMERLLEALYSYAALFDCLESTMSRTSLERFKVEKILFGEEIKNIIACEGAERKERHEKLDKWIQRLDSAGFGNVPLSYYGMLQARRLLQGYGCDGYRIKEENGSVLICWQDRPLYSVSAWRCRK